VTRALTTMPLTEAPLNFEVAAALTEVSLPHADPADHFLAASAKAFGLTHITSDRNLLRTREISVMEN
jgi:PIN domain nuclease of toxin-antitoxin system